VPQRYGKRHYKSAPLFVMTAIAFPHEPSDEFFLDLWA
jgi:hypothetical protein